MSELLVEDAPGVAGAAHEEAGARSSTSLRAGSGWPRSCRRTTLLTFWRISPTRRLPGESLAEAGDNIRWGQIRAEAAL